MQVSRYGTWLSFWFDATIPQSDGMLPQTIGMRFTNLSTDEDRLSSSEAGAGSVGPVVGDLSRQVLGGGVGTPSAHKLSR